jgi:hypothetical protein
LWWWCDDDGGGGVMMVMVVVEVVVVVTSSPLPLSVTSLRASRAKRLPRDPPHSRRRISL